jgi:hypothetical protein
MAKVDEGLLLHELRNPTALSLPALLLVPIGMRQVISATSFRAVIAQEQLNLTRMTVPTHFLDGVTRTAIILSVLAIAILSVCEFLKAFLAQA